MNEYRIFSEDGMDHGTWEGKTKTHALARMHRDAGYDVIWHEGADTYVVPDTDEARLVGAPNDWTARRIIHS